MSLIQSLEDTGRLRAVLTMSSRAESERFCVELLPHMQCVTNRIYYTAGSEKMLYPSIL